MTTLGPLEPLRGYLQLISGLGDVTRARAVDAAESLISLGTSVVSVAPVGQAGALAEEILEAARANRESLRALVRHEVERAVAAALSRPAPEIVRTGVAALGAQASRGLGGEARRTVPAATPDRTPTTTPATKVAAGTTPPPARKATTAKRVAPVKKTATAKKAAPVKKTATAKKAAPVKKAAPTKATPATKTSVTQSDPSRE